MNMNHEKKWTEAKRLNKRHKTEKSIEISSVAPFTREPSTANTSVEGVTS
ncbi:hypothetical protein VIBNISFn27_160134 [Vibrio nigripulchritudo SFn27]|nr:hypothetical protein VIBNIBLFn1_900011 [Vibrio nigripulchritudo BLFn1]CCN87651.1 hypothetical protein VIBNISFn27_160134 [Vibrio nigripulchritudo SFn27]CCN92532.1 hypothetical protein VIBNIENn2_1010133 [Vibrio nigripulchritudo ENn2]